MLNEASYRAADPKARKAWAAMSGIRLMSRAWLKRLRCRR
jgi:hypothetical protein